MFAQKEFDYSQTPEVLTIFNEFMDAFEERVVIDDFILVIQNACDDKCQLLMKKLLKNKGKKLDRDEFSALFNFELSEADNFDCLFEVFEDKKVITLEQLKQINQKYAIGLSEQEMKIMISYTQVKDQPITKQVFRSLIQ